MRLVKKTIFPNLVKKVIILAVDQSERISPSAWGVAFQRTLTDIPYASEVFTSLNSNYSASQRERFEQWKYPQLTPFFEARYKIINLLLKRNDAHQVLEIASGFSTRGLEMTHDPSMTYVEMDLPVVIREKRTIISKLENRSIISHRSNLHLEEGNTLHAHDLWTAAEKLKTDPIAIVNEGLLRYLSHEEKTMVAQNIRQLLLEFGGVWITPDIPARGMMATGPLKAIVREQNERMRSLTGIDVRKNYFQNENTARAFFEELGFIIERHPFEEVTSNLSSPSREGLSEDLVRDAIGQSAAYVMTTR